MMPWVCNRSWEGSSLGYTPLQDNILWDELILHLGMHGVNRFLYWTNVNPLSEPADSENNPVEDQRRLNELMQELDVHIGQMEAGSPLMQPSFGEDVTASAIADGQHVVWRFSFHPGVAAVAVRFTDGEEFYLQPEPGRRGVWFKHAAHRQLELNTLGSAPSLTAVIPSME
jgi:hypothetical protein